MAEKSISYSQFSVYMQCPKKWEMDYVQNKRVFEQSIHTIFGTAMHETLQNYLSVMYNQSVKEADEISLPSYLQDRMVHLYREASAQLGHFSTQKELHEFCLDGVQILKYFIKKRLIHFPAKSHELLGIETELDVPLVRNIKFRGFIDVVLKDHRTGKIHIIDFKTSTRGWTQGNKSDKVKTSQLILYKEFYAKQFGVDPEMIEVEYIILRRKINENAEFVAKRIQTFSPASGKPSRNKVANLLSEFIQTGFTEEGEYNTTSSYPAISSSNCKYCKYGKEGSCPVADRLKRD